MNTALKITLAIFFFSIVLIITIAVVKFQTTSKELFSTTPTPTFSPEDFRAKTTSLLSQFSTGYKLIDLGTLNFESVSMNRISKDQVKQWSNSSGFTTVSEGTHSAQLLAAKFKHLKDKIVTLAQGEKEVQIKFAPKARVFLNESGKIKIISNTFENLINPDILDSYVKFDDLVLILGVGEKSGQTQGKGMIIYK